MIPEIIRVTSLLLAIPFMALFYIKTDRLNFLKKYAILTLFIPIFARLIFTDIGFNIELIFAYMIFIIFGASIFNKKGWAYPQALSISFCLVFFASFLWEVPILTYTIIIYGGIDGAFPLHLLFIFPMVFIYEKIKTNRKKKDILFFGANMMWYSIFMLAILVASNINIWQITQESLANQTIAQFVWMTNRVIVIMGLFLIYIKSSLRRGDKK